jgi:hypothetical protein
MATNNGRNRRPLPQDHSRRAKKKKWQDSTRYP